MNDHTTPQTPPPPPPYFCAPGRTATRVRIWQKENEATDETENHTAHQPSNFCLRTLRINTIWESKYDARIYQWRWGNFEICVLCSLIHVLGCIYTHFLLIDYYYYNYYYYTNYQYRFLGKGGKDLL